MASYFVTRATSKPVLSALKKSRGKSQGCYPKNLYLHYSIAINTLPNKSSCIAHQLGLWNLIAFLFLGTVTYHKFRYSHIHTGVV